MATKRLSTIGIRPPVDFPVESYEAINSLMRPKYNIHFDLWRHYSAAWNGLAHRFVSCARYDKAFAKSVRRFSAWPNKSAKRHSQEHALFGFFVAGQSSVESLCYALFAIGSILKPAHFPIMDPDVMSKISPEMTADKFDSKKGFQKQDISTALRRMIDDQVYKEWKRVRNVLIHRQAPGRTLEMGGAAHGDVLWTEGITIDVGTTASRRKWLAETLRDLLDAANDFTSSHL